ncbi:hypothetical protein BGZ96_006807 [Linnemannia gamsii]|uniref:Uncharacterized protein n=1 Tax=Linnemannia gamsii TaxID=64522 RepID=A0ABQ7K2B9_9FUNG|nr:hypothetical protein BGZ96_006807 [Linnemannia gamsii]
MAALASNRDDGALGPLGDHELVEDSHETSSSHTAEIASAPIVPALVPATVSAPSPRTVAPVIAPQSPPVPKSIAAAPKSRRVSTTPMSSPPPNHPHPFIQTVPQPAMRAVPRAVPRPVSQPVSQPVSHQSLQSVLHSALQSAAAALQPPTTTSTAVVPAQKARAVTKGKQQLQEDDDDEDDEEDDDDEVDDAHLVPSERHLHSFIGHWQGWCRGRRYKDKDYITPQKVLAYVKSMISPGFQLDRLNPPLHVPAFNGETEKYLPSWTTVHMNILSIQVLYNRQCERDKTTPDANVMNHTKLKSLLFDYRKRSQAQDPNSKYILDPRLFQPRVESTAYCSSVPQQLLNVIPTAHSPSPPAEHSSIGQSNGNTGFVNANGNNISHSNGNSTLGHLTNIPNAHGPYNPPDTSPQYCMHSALATMEMEMFMSSLRSDVMAAVNRSVEYSLATHTAIESLGGRMDQMEQSARKSMMDVTDTGMTDVEMRDLELYYRRRATQLRQSRLDRKKVLGATGTSSSTQKRTDRQLREERGKWQEIQPLPYTQRPARSQSAEYYHPDGHSEGDDDNDGEEDQFYDMLPEDEMPTNGYGYHSDIDMEGGDGYESDLRPTGSRSTRTRLDKVKEEKYITLKEDDYDLLPRKNATRRSIAAGSKASPLAPRCDMFLTRELNVLADDIAGHYSQIEEKKTEENFIEDLLLPRNAGLVQLWTEMFSSQEKQPSLWGMNVYANGWHLKLEMKVKQRVALKKKIIASVLAKIQAEIEYVASAKVPVSKVPSLKEMVKSALIAVELEIKRDGSINAYHDRIKRRGNQE